MIKFFEWLWLRGIKNWWSKLRWWKASKEPSGEVMKTTDTTIQENCRYLYQGFDWVMDGIDDLFDTYMPAPYAYNRCIDALTKEGAKKLDGDCDDFHGAVLNMLDHNGYDAALITLATIPITQSHTMTTYRKVDGQGYISFYVVDYTRLLGPYKNIEDFVNDYNPPVRYWCLQKYDYKKGKYYNISKSWGTGNKGVK